MPGQAPRCVPSEQRRTGAGGHGSGSKQVIEAETVEAAAVEVSALVVEPVEPAQELSPETDAEIHDGAAPEPEPEFLLWPRRWPRRRRPTTSRHRSRRPRRRRSCRSLWCR